MKRNRTHFVQQTAKAALISSVAFGLLLPAGLAGAATTKTKEAVTVTALAAPAEKAASASADPAKVKFTKEAAIAKLKELFPILKDATVSNVQLGVSNMYPAPLNQMVWTIQWEYRVGNGGYGFSSSVDAINGDLLNTYISYPLLENESYYPPKLTKEQALEKAQAFISKAAASIKSSDLQLDENINYNLNNGALFGPIQYSFSFRLLKNGIYSSADSIMISVNGNGDVTQFFKQGENLEYPSAKPVITKEQAEKSFADSFDVGLYYVPVRKNGLVNNWVLGWRPVEQTLLPIDALTGKRLDYEGSNMAAVPMTYTDVPQGKNLFKPNSTGNELTAEQAAILVKKVANIPADYKLISQSLGNDYQNKDMKLWRLTWGNDNRFNGGPPSQSYAEVDAQTGEILQFMVDQYAFDTTKKPAAPAGSKKLTQKEAKQKALELVNQMYNKASTNLKYVEHGGTWEVNPDKTGYRYQFIQFYKGIPVADSFVTLNLDLYGNVKFFSTARNIGIEKVTQEPVPVITKKEALATYQSEYKLTLQYYTIGGNMINNSYTAPKIKLVYSATPLDVQKSMEIIDATTGKRVSVYEFYGVKGSTATTDLKGHSAEKELSELVRYNVITPDADGKVNPDQEITVGDWITLIVKASTPYYEGYYGGAERKPVAGVNPESPYYSAVVFAVDRGWLSRDAVVQTDSKLTREQLAVLLTSFVKYNKISAFLDKDSTINQFSDISSISNKGAIALVVKLGLMKDDNGKFNPQLLVTKAQAASVIMKLVELQGKTDQKIGQSSYGY
ncbi:YcdB/YcdC domain-containing protein [Paenibacillus wynnii]|uniref:YcdB/YcdC domain-containing protein n=1 Tax=Paenibacillus wynnii TaxID=268407 RepID=UPI002791E4BA|nr:YcdB/YcdC domain-containing protein [Paenibacillus wynnii]MDQ0194626.1 hypothetical protein [Paenibacillus wynnii]